jgi:50S ribosomal protein L16 3-hydroxylase
MRQLADERRLNARVLARASEGARALLAEWVDSGWLFEETGDD